MRLAKLNLVDYRNIETARLEFDSRRVFLLGANGQGKTNLLEAIGFSFALRSFRTSEVRDLIRWERPRSELLFRFENASGNLSAWRRWNFFLWFILGEKVDVVRIIYSG